jgi:hypothetical protein
MSAVFTGTEYLYAASVPYTSIPVTISCWFKDGTTNGDSYRSVFSVGQNATTIYHRIHSYELGGSERELAGWVSDGINTRTSEYATDISGSVIWRHVALTVTTSGATLFLNGSGQTPSGSVVDAFSVFDRMSIGAAYRNTVSMHYIGSVAECAVYNAELSQDNIDLLAAGRYPNEVAAANLLNYWPLLSDANDPVGSLNLTNSGSASFSSGDHPSMNSGSKNQTFLIPVLI